MNQYSADEMKVRLTIIEQIVVASRDIRNLPPMDADRLQAATQAWEAALSRVATQHLTELYRIGLAHKCTTAEQFQNVWELKVEAEHRAAEHRARLAKRGEPQVSAPIPQFILDSWGAQTVAN